MTIGADRLSPKVTAAAVSAGLAAGVWALVSARTGRRHPAVAVPLRATLPPGTAGRITGRLPDLPPRRPDAELSQDVAVRDHEETVISSSVLATLLGALRPAQAQAILLVKVQGYSV